MPVASDKANHSKKLPRTSIKAKKCYGHLGGKLGERVFSRLVELHWFRLENAKATVYDITDKGREELKKLGIDLNP